jgi:hypothetical protein
MVRIVGYDANVLYPSLLRDLLIRIAQAGLGQAKWTNQILDETFRNLEANRPDLDPAALHRTRKLMIRAVRDCLVAGYEQLIPALQLPDPADRHVLAAAIKAHAQTVVTKNLGDFPPGILGCRKHRGAHPDEFVLDLRLHPASRAHPRRSTTPRPPTLGAAGRPPSSEFVTV